MAISDAATVDPTQPTRRTEMPQMLPVGMSAYGLGLTEDFGVLFGSAPALEDLDVATFALGGTQHRLGMRDESPRFRRAASGSFGGSFHRVAGRVVLATPTRLVIEFDVGAMALAWHPAGTAIVQVRALPHVHERPIEMQEGTAPGRIEPGLTVRVVLQLDQELPALPESVTIGLDGGGLLIIDIEAA